MEKLWSILYHFGTNMWNEIGNSTGGGTPGSPILLFNHDLFRELAVYGRQKGANAILLDIGEGLKYESHPEIAVDGAWSREKLENEIAWLKQIGYEVIPKLNFSACHDAWLGDYSRMVSSPIYYKVVEDLIAEVCDIFKPKYFHLGMDEEKEEMQKNLYYSVVRHGELWWHDLYHMIDCTEKYNARPWIWCDRVWNYPEEFVEKCPKEVILSNWYYADGWGLTDEYAKVRLPKYAYLDEHGYEQVPAGSNYADDTNMLGTTKYCTEHISDKGLMGFMQTPWCRTIEKKRGYLFNSVNQLGDSREWFESRNK